MTLDNKVDTLINIPNMQRMGQSLPFSTGMWLVLTVVVSVFLCLPLPPPRVVDPLAAAGE